MAAEDPLLVFATSGPAAAVGLSTPAGLRTLPLGEGAARGRDLLPRVEALLREAGLSIHDVTGIAVDVGPGSFTGVRVGVTAAKTLAYALDVPAAPVVSLEALALAAGEGPALAVRDAGRGLVYWARYGRGGIEAGPGRADPGALREVAEGARVVLEAGLEDRFPWTEPLVAAVTVASVHRLGSAALAGGRRASPHDLAPLYLQASAPERKRLGEA
jgi:tRNA threonylcarbamoyladenosine biosynthesis protein TsaB